MRRREKAGAHMRLSNTVAAALLAALLAGCAPVISENTLRTVDRDISFSSVVADPAAFTGRSVVFGGTILGIENMEGATVIEVVQEGMNSQLKPLDRGSSAGRFLARFDRFMDPAIFSAGRRITVAGIVAGSETRPLGKGTYRYPVIEPTEHYLWDPGDYDRGGDPRIGIGIGIGLGYTHIERR